LRLAILPGAVAAVVFVIARPAVAVERYAMLAEAELYEDHVWSCTEVNHWGTGCPSTYESDFCPGTYEGLPYDWGGFVTLDQFDQDLSAGKGAGSHSWHGVLSCTTGLDCSGYVSILWETPWKYGTSTLHQISDAIDARDMWPGDVYNNAGSHVIMWVGKDEDGAAVITESSGTCNGVCRRSVGWGTFASYVPRAAWDDYVQTATAGDHAGTADDPIPIGSFPFRDFRNTRYATSSIFDYYSAAPDVNESGPEYIYVLVLPGPGTLTASVLDAPGVDIDLHLLGSLSADDCLARAHIDLTVEIEAGGTYYLTADSWVGANDTVYSGAYVLDVDFAAADADTDADTDAGGDTDTGAGNGHDCPPCAETGGCADGGCGCGAVGASRIHGILGTVLGLFL